MAIALLMHGAIGYLGVRHDSNVAGCAGGKAAIGGEEGIKNHMTPALLRRTVICLVLVLLAGCNGIARSGPGESAITSKSADLAGFTLIDMEAENVVDYRVRSLSDGAGTAGVPSAPKVSLSSGDVLRIRVSETKEGGVFAPLAVARYRRS